MQLNYLCPNADLQVIFDLAEKELLLGKKLKFERTKAWRNQHVPGFSGLYALYEKEEDLLYIAETGNLRERMADICRTVNHTFRRQFGHRRFGGVKTKKKFNPEVEALLDLFF